ncbi:hypothetical protein Kpol_385p3 [Vanderwaltozyma polyspora DSM 70294]|uniref:GATA-type domain-containing protein n=1 Tax=Vanderwaltozyma polyspora (strain ATCC 22028 / DSM 70294 / BCRC 21397 / CBS 2163 / NBRC 10782 / NRRL Y-8283 / UCD 57-17) TaxID=436907 RepID=A7TS15_VANPO|nr:uncharacterized protein Kpol_385p3 [Vanderwaltozyma polyspora DSM 70294]EDO14934.1 hypothetical protein Kpol_385p3 [Vanderwaltozyma polyspora DSM 70294]
MFYQKIIPKLSEERFEISTIPTVYPDPETTNIPALLLPPSCSIPAFNGSSMSAEPFSFDPFSETYDKDFFNANRFYNPVANLKTNMNVILNPTSRIEKIDELENQALNGLLSLKDHNSLNIINKNQCHYNFEICSQDPNFIIVHQEFDFDYDDSSSGSDNESEVDIVSDYNEEDYWEEELPEVQTDECEIETHHLSISPIRIENVVPDNRGDIIVTTNRPCLMNLLFNDGETENSCTLPKLEEKPSILSRKRRISSNDTIFEKRVRCNNKQHLPKKIKEGKLSSSNKNRNPFGQCLHCGDTETPEWRKGPSGPTSLCNACGLFYKKLLEKSTLEDANLLMKERFNSNPYNRRIPKGYGL